MKQREDEFPTEGYAVISEEEFNNRVRKGETLCILDNLVLNLQPYFHQHPGGAFLLTQTVGRDISKFFYGGYTLDGNGGKPGSNKKVHAHTNVARKVAIQHVVAFIGCSSVNEDKYRINHEHTMQINKWTNSFVFKSTSPTPMGTSIQNFYSDLSMLGKHFTIVSWQDGEAPIREGKRQIILRRHYTICNVMRKQFYAALYAAI